MTDTTHDQTDGDQETQAVESEATETTDTTDTHDTESADTSSQEREDDDSQVDDDSSDDDDDEDDSPRDEDIQKLIRKNRKTNRENQKLRERATAAEHKLAQFMAAQETGLPADMALRLQGSTPEELKADAEKLKELFSNRRFVPGGLPGDGVRFGSDEGDSTETDLTKIGARIYER
ncbi:hypothetical protein CFAL_12020 (plasmid) [Corynebacterium falsenii DSM 44353]|uniref:hypothetical protein n=1 Tax=Corynebacterium falsenii TaxID=108486 RepID=UPI0003E92B02|nr:hypothetical protein [Corynebacterium falsenii]AHI04378.1 hypothetical protein CFAL_09700 [Corynebacterium falsenii DSM 44353]AHI04481.1 hypothetical protein CFAL_12020 [Corynebacterium falsenii DSM 44353]UBI04585.1 hypothetical protein LA343_11540 [Corynebacterium falsenii]